MRNYLIVSSLKFYCCLVFLSSLAGCQSLESAISSPGVNSIKSLSPKDTLVYIKGKVSNQAPFLSSGSYQVTDETGKIWVLTSLPLPKVGESFLVKGELHSEEGELYVRELEKSPQTSQ